MTVPMYVKHNFLGPDPDEPEVYAKRMHFVDAKWESTTHAHQSDHITAVVKGVIGIEIFGQEYEHGPGTFIFVPKGERHRLWSKGPEQAVAYCIHITDHANPDTIDNVLIQEKKNASI